MVVKDLINCVPVLVLNIVRLSVKDCFSFFVLLFTNSMEKTWIRESSFNPLSPNSDQNQFSSNDIHTLSRD